MQLLPRRNQRRLEDILREDRDTLNRLGYAQELLREVSALWMDYSREPPG